MIHPSDLEAIVATMRRLGVIECDGVKLGPEPAQAKSATSDIEGPEDENPVARVTVLRRVTGRLVPRDPASE